MQPKGAHPILPDRLAAMVEAVKCAFRAGLGEGTIADIAFIGNASPVYAWVPCRMVDLDCFLFVPRLDRSLGDWLSRMQTRVGVEFDAVGVDFEVRIIEGPYKPSAAGLERPIIVAHLGVFTEEMYRAAAPLKRWAWRKYACEVEPARLQRLAPPRPSLDEFVHGSRGLLERLAALEAGRVAMVEWLLPELAPTTFFIDRGSVAFQECCFAYTNNCARNHARALALIEADLLGNADFVAWYVSNVFSHPPLRELFAMKAEARDRGFVHDTGRVHEATVGYLRALAAHLGAVIPEVG